MKIFRGYGFVVANGTYTTWQDEFGNSVVPIWTRLDVAHEFESGGGLQAGETIQNAPLSAAMRLIVDCIEKRATFFAVNPSSRDSFRASAPVEFLTELINDAWKLGEEDDSEDEEFFEDEDGPTAEKG